MITGYTSTEDVALVAHREFLDGKEFFAKFPDKSSLARAGSHAFFTGFTQAYWENRAFPELNHAENSEIVQARMNGFCGFFPAFPTAEAQAKNTLNAAREFNRV